MMNNQSSGRRRVSICAALLGALVSATAAGAQRVAASYGIERSSHELLGTLSGGTVQIGSGRLGRVSVAVGGRRFTGTTTHTGVACAGYIVPPKICPTELIHDATTADEFVGTVEVFLFRLAPRGLSVEGAAIVGLQRVWLYSDSYGLATGNQLSAREALVGTTLGFDLTARSSAQAPFGLRLGASIVSQSGSDVVVIDGRMPFSEGYRAVRGEIGLAWFISRRFFLEP